MSLTAPPVAPSITRPDTFEAESEAWVAWLTTFRDELDAIIGTTIPDGSAAAGTLTGATLAANVLASSLTSVGTLAGLTVSSGVQFPATQAASANANNLDDYEEGTFTPTLLIGGANSSSYSTQYGRYTKVGNIVFFFINILLSAKGINTGLISLGALPFTALSNSALNVPCSVYATALDAGATTAIDAIVINNTVTINLYQYAAGVETQLTDADLTDTSNIVLRGHYYV